MHHVNRKVLVNMEESCSQRTIPQTVEKLRRRRMDATHRPMSRSVWTTVWRKGFVCQCHCIVACPTPKFGLCVEVTGTFQWLTTAVRASACQSWCQECFICPHHLSVHVLQSTWCAGPVCSNV